MAKKKDKEDTKTASPTPNGIPNRDIIQRLNFLNQASVYLQQISSTPEHDSTSTLERGGVQDLSRFYVRCMKTIGTKAVVKMDPAMKRTLCRGCSTVLIPGITSSVRARTSSHRHTINHKCFQCGQTRSIPSPPTLPTPPNQPKFSAEGDESSGGAKSQTDQEQSDVVLTDADSPRKTKRPKRRRWRARLPPLFERDVGHVVFRGNELVD